MTDHQSSNKIDLIRKITDLSSEWFDTDSLIANADTTTAQIEADTIQPLIEAMTAIRDVAEKLQDKSFSEFCINTIVRELEIDPDRDKWVLSSVNYGDVYGMAEVASLIVGMCQALERLGHNQIAEVLIENVWSMSDASMLDKYSLPLRWGRRQEAYAAVFDLCDTADELVRVISFIAWVADRPTDPKLRPILSDQYINTLRRYHGVPFEWIPLNGLVYCVDEP